MPLSDPLLAALLAAVISLLGLVISKESKVSDFRQKWIDDLRQDVSSLIANALHVSRRITVEDVAEEVSKCNEATACIRLRLNSSKAQHVNVRESMLRLANAVHEKARQDKITSLATDLSDTTQILLKSEWERVKAGERVYRYTLRSLFLLFTLVVLKYLRTRF